MKPGYEGNRPASEDEVRCTPVERATLHGATMVLTSQKHAAVDRQSEGDRRW